MSAHTSQERASKSSRLTEIGEQAVAAVAASLARGGPVVKGQLIASRFYEAMQRELKRLPMHDPKRAATSASWVSLYVPAMIVNRRRTGRARCVRRA